MGSPSSFLLLYICFLFKDQLNSSIKQWRTHIPCFSLDAWTKFIRFCFGFFPKYNFAQNSLVSPDLNSLSQATVVVRICFSSSQKTVKYAFQEQTYKVLYGKWCFLMTLDVNCLASSWMTWPWIFACFHLQKIKKVSLVFQNSFILNDSYVLNYSMVFTKMAKLLNSVQ